MVAVVERRGTLLVVVATASPFVGSSPWVWRGIACLAGPRSFDRIVAHIVGGIAHIVGVQLGVGSVWVA